MAYSIINGASVATEDGHQSIWELADDLEYKLGQIAESARHASLVIRALVELQPDGS